MRTNCTSAKRGLHVISIFSKVKTGDFVYMKYWRLPIYSWPELASVASLKLIQAKIVLSWRRRIWVHKGTFHVSSAWPEFSSWYIFSELLGLICLPYDQRFWGVHPMVIRNFLCAEWRKPKWCKQARGGCRLMRRMHRPSFTKGHNVMLRCVIRSKFWRNYCSKW